MVSNMLEEFVGQQVRIDVVQNENYANIKGKLVAYDNVFVKITYNEDTETSVIPVATIVSIDLLQGVNA